MGNFLFIKVAIVIAIGSFFGCKRTIPSGRNIIPPENNIISSVNITKYKQYDELISKWVGAYKEGDDVTAKDYATKLLSIAKKEEREIEKLLTKYIKERNDNLKPLAYVGLVLAGFTNNCVFVSILEQYLLIDDKGLLANALLGISKLNRCNFSLNRVLWFLENEFDEMVILNALQVILQHYVVVDVDRLESIVEKFLKNRNPLIANQSIRVIAKYKLGQFKKTLMDEFLFHPITFIRTNAAIALSRICDKSIVKELK